MHGVSPEVRWACAGGCNGHHEGEHKKTPSCPATSIPNETIRTPVRTKMTYCVHCDVVFFGVVGHQAFVSFFGAVVKLKG